MGESGQNRPPETILVEDERQRELRELKERANRLIESSLQYLHEQYEDPSDEVVYVALQEILSREGDDVPGFLDAYRGRTPDDIPKEDFERTREWMKMQFHRAEHSREVLARTELILEAMINGGVDLREEDFQLARVIAAGHDLVQNWTTKQHANGKIERLRFKGPNEDDSADMLIDMLRQQGFSNINEDIIRAAFNATIARTWDGKTVVQEFLLPDSHPVVRAIALADLGAAGTDPTVFIRGGDELFREENLDMLNLDIASLTEEEKEAYMERMLNWSKSQQVFAAGREERFEEELGNLPDAAKDELHAIFSKFRDSMKRAHEAWTTRRGLSFEDLYEVMGFVRES